MNAIKFAAIMALFCVLMGLVIWAPRRQEEAATRPGEVRQLIDEYRSEDALAAALILATPALCLYTLRRATEPLATWRVFWTLAFIALVVYLGSFGFGSWTAGLGWLVLIAAVWWAVDVVLAWAVEDDIPWVRTERGLLHVLVFLGYSTEAIIHERGAVRFLGVVMAVAGLGFAVYRLVIRPFDSNSFSGRLFIKVFEAIDRFVPWYDLPTPIAVLNLAAFREVLRAKNLHDTSEVPVSSPGGLSACPAFRAEDLVARQLDGYYDDLAKPSMGSASTAEPTTRDSMYFRQSNPGARFGRNVPLADAHPDAADAILKPSPREISNTLLARDTFKPARTLNLLAAAWIQFETHDWFNHGEPLKEDEAGPWTAEQKAPWKVPIAEGDHWLECPMRIRPTRPDPTRDYVGEPREGGRAKYPPTYANAESHWWDASQIYGSNPETTARLRGDGAGGTLPHGHLSVGKDRLPIDPETGDVALSGFTGNWWIGLSLLHLLFTKEHNAICDRLRLEYPDWDGDKLFGVARLINAALMAKIHTVEWTPAILGHPALQVAMAANWWGLLGQKVRDLFGRISESEAFSGIPGSGVDHHTADYSLTEEFTSVYRMHPLVPDELKVVSAADGRPIHTWTFPDGVLGPEGELTALKGTATQADLLYSFGIANPGAITLHNFPNYLRRLTRPDGEVVDLASIDILRDRERGVPRYNRFRELIHRGRVRSFAEITDNPTWAAELERVYEGDVDKVDLLVGMLAETPPPGFGFSDTAFRIFILMASRRLKSDRFIAGDAFSPEVYTQVGLDWLEQNSMISVLIRHYPELAPALLGAKNAFAPWNRVVPGTGWNETFLGGSQEGEDRMLREFADREVPKIQANFTRKDHAPKARRAFHAKIHIGVTDARLRINDALPEEISGVGPFQPGREWRAIVRLSNAIGRVQSDQKGDGKGIGIRLCYDGGEHDLLLSNSPNSHARTARHFIISGLAASGPTLLALPLMIRELGLAETIHLVRIAHQTSSKPVRSLATETFWSRTPYSVGPLEVAVKFLLKPDQPSDSSPIPPGDHYLRDDMVERLRTGDVEYHLQIQRWVDEERTPLEDGTAVWDEQRVSSPVTIASLVIPRQDLTTPEAKAAQDTVEGLAFNPWHFVPGIPYRPLGSLNRSRRLSYRASAEGRLGVAPVV